MRAILTNIGSFVNFHQRDVVIVAAMGLIAWSFFNIGKMHSATQSPIAVTKPGPELSTATERPSAKAIDARVVVSKSSSSKKYHFSWCASGQRINPENQVWFETAALAEQAGYSLAGNCQ